MIRSMMESSPSYKKLLEKNPELEQILNNPSMMNELVESMSNPAYQKEMMKNQDRALSNIEMLPEGFNHLRKAYASIQEPLFNAMDESTAVRLTDSSSNLDRFPPKNTLNTEPLPNPWSRSNRLANPSPSVSPLFSALGKNENTLSRLASLRNGLGNADATSFGSPRHGLSSSSSSPEEVYSNELKMLQDMGFHDHQENLRALITVQGNVQLAIELLLGQMNS